MSISFVSLSWLLRVQNGIVYYLLYSLIIGAILKFRDYHACQTYHAATIEKC